MMHRQQWVDERGFTHTEYYIETPWGLEVCQPNLAEMKDCRVNSFR